MTSSTIIKKVAEKLNMTQKDIKTIADTFEVVVKESLMDGEKFKFADVSYDVKDVPAHTGFNPVKNEPMEIAATRKVTLKPSKDMKLVVK